MRRSYLDEKSPTFIDSLFVSVVNSFTSIFAGFVVFAVLGYELSMTICVRIE